MDVLDTLDLSYMENKCRRVSLWYLNEQYKALEQNQLEAAQNLKERSLQDKLLYREISERRVRRRLYNEFSTDDNNINSAYTVETRSPINSVNTENFFESFSDLQDLDQDSDSDQIINTCNPNIIDSDDTILDDWSSKDSVAKCDRTESECYCKEQDDQESHGTSMNSVMEIKCNSDAFTIDQQEIDSFEVTVKENDDILKEQVLKDFNETFEDNKLSDIQSSYLEAFEKPYVQKKNIVTYDNSLNVVWSKLVCFAYQVLQLNRGNCYYDCSCEILTAVLICDVLVKGINNVCNMLQPYISPVKFASTDDESDDHSLEMKKKKQTKFLNKMSKKLKKFDDIKTSLHSYDTSSKVNNITKKCLCKKRNYQSENMYLKENLLNERTALRRSSEPWDRMNTDSCRNGKCQDVLNCLKNYCEESDFDDAIVKNPMLKLVRYIDKELDSRQKGIRKIK